MWSNVSSDMLSCIATRECQGTNGETACRQLSGYRDVGTILERSPSDDAYLLSESSRPHDTPQHQLYAITTFATMIGIPVSALTTTWCDPPRISNAHALPATKGRPITNINQE